MTERMMARVMMAGLAYVLAAGSALAQGACPPATVASSGGLRGAFPQQFELSEFERIANCKLAFKANPEIEQLNARIAGNGALPPLAERLPAEPLVVMPYESIGRYGGTFVGLSEAPEAGTSDLLSFRHVSLVRYADDLATIVPNVAKSWEWNKDFTELTFTLRRGHKWSDGTPFTAADIKFWHDDLMHDENVTKKARDYILVGGKPMTVEVIDAVTVKFKLPAPKPGLLAFFASHYSQPFQPVAFIGRFHPRHNKDADALAKSLGFANGYAAVSAYYANSDWKDVPTPMLSHPDKVARLPKATAPTLESFITITETADGRRFVANPYFHMVDTAGNQLPYISRFSEDYVKENEVRLLKAINAEFDYKSQSVQLPAAPMLLEHRQKGDYSVDLRPTIAMPTFGFNVTSPDPEKRKLFADLRFRQAMSVAINRAEINEVAFFGLGEPRQYTAFSPLPPFVPAALQGHLIQYDPAMARRLLDEIGMRDRDNDGARELPNGARFTLNIQFATQGMPAQVAELVAQQWSAVGVRTTIKEITPDELRSAQSANQLDVVPWLKGQPLALIQGNAELFMPPFENYFGGRIGMLWAEYVESNGAKGEKPPAFVEQMMADITAFQSAAPGGKEASDLGARLAKTMTESLLWIGTVQAPAPVYHRNRVKNFPEFKTWSADYYRTYPYRPQQWFLSDGK